MTAATIQFRTDDKEKTEHWAKLSTCGAVQNYIYDWNSKIAFLYGGMRTAKTVATMQKIMLAPVVLGELRDHAVYGPCRLLRILVVRESLTSFEGTIYETMKEFFSEEFRIGKWGDKTHTPKAQYRMNGELCVLEFRAFGLVDEDKFENIRGGGYDIALFNEMPAMLKHERGFNMVKSRVGSPKKGKANMKTIILPDGSEIKPGRIWGDTNPPSDAPHHWFYDLFPKPSRELHDKYPDDGYSQNFADTPEWKCYYLPNQLTTNKIANPAWGDDRSFYEDLSTRARQAVVDEQVRGLVPEMLTAKAFYPSFRRELHVIDYTPNPTLPVLAGSDADRWGGQVLAQISENGQLVVFDGMPAEYESGVAQAKKFINLMQGKYLGFRFHQGWIDPAANQRGVQTDSTFWDAMRNAFDAANLDYRFFPAPFPQTVRPNSIAYRQEVVERLLRENLPGIGNAPRPSLVFAKSARKVIESMISYRFEMRKDGSFQDRPIKDEASGLADAVAYLCAGVEKTIFSRTRSRERPASEYFPDAKGGGYKNAKGQPVRLLSRARREIPGQRDVPLETHLAEVFGSNSGDGL